jgi:glycosyltransferase involved in cell wall biosynthesis
MPSVVSVIVATYNWKEALALSIRSLFNQSVLPHEIIIADDGSGEDTRKLIEELRAESSISVVHCWHEDKGFRLAAIRNKAIGMAKGDYIIQIDGDIICHPDFIRDHLLYSREKTFVCGKRVNLSKEDSLNTLKNNHLTVSRESFLNNKAANKIRSEFLMKLLKGKVNRLISKGVMGCNMSYSKEDALKVNGYNSDIQGWGREDDEFILRLQNAGCRKKMLKFGGIAYHLFHKEAPRDSFNSNDYILNETRKRRIIRAENGIISAES